MKFIILFTMLVTIQGRIISRRKRYLDHMEALERLEQLEIRSKLEQPQKQGQVKTETIRQFVDQLTRDKPNMKSKSRIPYGFLPYLTI